MRFSAFIFFTSLLLCPFFLKASNCEPALSEIYAAHQAWLIQSAKAYAQNHSAVSMRVEDSYFETLNTDREGGHIISFGSGPDVFRPLIDFPNAKHFHLVDLFSGWGSSPAEALFEAKKRLLHIHPTAKVRTVRRGFIEHLPMKVRSFLTTVERESIYSAELNQVSYRRYSEKWRDGLAILWQPWVLEVRWRPEGVDMYLGEEKKLFYFHPLDFHREDQIDGVLKRIESDSRGLQGVILTGSAVPGTLSSILSTHLKGRFVLEAFSDDLQFKKLLRDLKSTGDFQIKKVQIHTYKRTWKDPPIRREVYVISRDR